MKLHFEPNLDFQLQAIEAVCDFIPRSGDLSDRIYGYFKSNDVLNKDNWPSLKAALASATV